MKLKLFFAALFIALPAALVQAEDAANEGHRSLDGAGDLVAPNERADARPRQQVNASHDPQAYWFLTSHTVPIRRDRE